MTRPLSRRETLKALQAGSLVLLLGALGMFLLKRGIGLRS